MSDKKGSQLPRTANQQAVDFIGVDYKEGAPKTVVVSANLLAPMTHVGAGDAQHAEASPTAAGFMPAAMYAKVLAWPDTPPQQVSVSWGNISGDISTQTDLVNALAGKASASHTHEYVSADRRILTSGLLNGGGTLTSDLTLSLEGDDGTTPGASKYYGTDGAGVIGIHSLPAYGESSVAGIDGVDDVLTRYGETLYAQAVETNVAVTPDWANGNFQRFNLAANITALNRPAAIVDPVASTVYSITLEFVQDATGGRTVSINATPDSDGFNVVGGLPTIGSAPGEVTTLIAWTEDGGASWFLMGTVMAANVGFDPTLTGLSDQTVQAALVRALNASITIGAGLSGPWSVKAGGTLAVLFAGSGTATTAAKSDHTHTALIPGSGATGQVLKKASPTSYDVVWADESGGGGGTTYIGARDLYGGDFTWTFDGPRSVNGGDFTFTYS